jgi:hypothetical protein
MCSHPIAFFQVTFYIMPLPGPFIIEDTHTNKEEKWIGMYVRSAVTFMIRLPAIRTTEYLLELNSKTCPMTGFARCAARPRKILKKSNNQGTRKNSSERRAGTPETAYIRIEQNLKHVIA